MFLCCCISFPTGVCQDLELRSHPSFLWSHQTFGKSGGFCVPLDCAYSVLLLLHKKCTHCVLHAHAHTHTRARARTHARTHAHTHTHTHTHTHHFPHTHLSVQISYQLSDNLQLFGENLYGIHSIEYDELESFFYLFAVLRDRKCWLSWSEVCSLADELGIPTVPVVYTGRVCVCVCMCMCIFVCL